LCGIVGLSLGTCRHAKAEYSCYAQYVLKRKVIRNIERESKFHFRARGAGGGDFNIRCIMGWMNDLVVVLAAKVAGQNDV
jgi:hypothetical protein